MDDAAYEALMARLNEAYPSQPAYTPADVKLQSGQITRQQGQDPVMLMNPRTLQQGESNPIDFDQSGGVAQLGAMVNAGRLRGMLDMSAQDGMTPGYNAMATMQLPEGYSASYRRSNEIGGLGDAQNAIMLAKQFGEPNTPSPSLSAGASRSGMNGPITYDLSGSVPLTTGRNPEAPQFRLPSSREEQPMVPPSRRDRERQPSRQEVKGAATAGLSHSPRDHSTRANAGLKFNFADGGHVDAAMHLLRQHFDEGGFLSSLSNLFSGPDYLSTGEVASPTNWGDPESAADFFKADRALRLAREASEPARDTPLPLRRPAPEAAPRQQVASPPPVPAPVQAFRPVTTLPIGDVEPHEFPPVTTPSLAFSQPVYGEKTQRLGGGEDQNKAPAVQMDYTIGNAGALWPSSGNDIQTYAGIVPEDFNEGIGNPMSVDDVRQSMMFRPEPRAEISRAVSLARNLAPAQPEAIPSATDALAAVEKLHNAGVYSGEALDKAGEILAAHNRAMFDSIPVEEALRLNRAAGPMMINQGMPREERPAVQPLAYAETPAPAQASQAISEVMPAGGKLTARIPDEPHGTALTKQQADYVIRTIAAETSGKSPEETQAIASVILNRINSGKYGASPEAVLFAKRQFEPWMNPAGKNYPMKISPTSQRYSDARDALEAAMAGEDITRGATNFWGPKSQYSLGRDTPDWALEMPDYTDIGATRFHRPNKRAEGGLVDDALHVVREHHADGEAVGQAPEMPAEDPRPLTIYRGNAPVADEAGGSGREAVPAFSYMPMPESVERQAARQPAYNPAERTWSDAGSTEGERLTRALGVEGELPKGETFMSPQPTGWDKYKPQRRPGSYMKRWGEAFNENADAVEEGLKAVRGGNYGSGALGMAGGALGMALSPLTGMERVLVRDPILQYTGDLKKAQEAEMVADTALTGGVRGMVTPFAKAGSLERMATEPWNRVRMPSPGAAGAATAAGAMLAPDEAEAGAVEKALRAIRAYQDPVAHKIADWKWRPLSDVHQELGLTELPPHVQAFGDYMKDMSDKAGQQGLTARDMIKGYTTTRASIQRRATDADNLRRLGLNLSPDVEKIRPEGAWMEWLGTPMGQKFLNEAAKGDISGDTVADAVKIMAPFGRHETDIPDSMRWAAKNIPGREVAASDLVHRAAQGASTPEEWRNFTSDIRGVGPSKSGFLASLYGRGDQPTLDARQIILNTGEPTKLAAPFIARSKGEGGVEAVNRLAARQAALGLEAPSKYDPFYQHLAHHAIWDKASNEMTTHGDIIKGMRNYAEGGEVEARQDPMGNITVPAAGAPSDEPGLVDRAMRFVSQFNPVGSAEAGPLTKVVRKVVSPEDAMMMVHNLKSHRLADVEKLGGLPVPSTAIVKPSQGFTNFGDITMVAPKEMAQPSRTNPIFGADVYSPRFPAIDDAGERIFKGFTPSGTRRYSPLTLENAVKEMKGNIRGGEGFDYGAGTIRSGVAPQFKSIGEIQNARDLIKPREEMQGAFDLANEKLNALAEKYYPHYNYGGDQWTHMRDFSDMLREAGMGKWGELRKTYKSSLPPELYGETTDFLNYLKGLPTEYFEGKPQRAVRLNEFRGAVVPGDIAGEQADILRRMGVERLEQYDPNSPASRIEALQKFGGEQFAKGGSVVDRALMLVSRQA